jgi:hypothetical protein
MSSDTALTVPSGVALAASLPSGAQLGWVLTAGPSGTILWQPASGGVPISALGAANDAVKVTDGAITTLTTLTCATSQPFTSSSVGKIIGGPGIPAGTTISSYTSASVVGLSQNCTNGSSLTICFGTDALAAVNAAIAAVGSGPGQIIVSGPNVLSAAPTSMQGSNGIKFIGPGGVIPQIMQGGSPGTIFGPLPQACLITLQSSPTFTDGVTVTSSNTIQSNSAAPVASDLGCPVNASFLPAGTHITGVNTGSKTYTLSQNITGSGGSGQSFTLGRPFLNAFLSNAFALEYLGVLSGTPNFIGVLAHSGASSGATATSGPLAIGCTIGEVQNYLGKCYGVTLTRCYSPRFTNCRFYGGLIQVLNTIGGSFANNTVCIGCIFDGYGLVAFRNPSEGTALLGCAVGTNAAGTDCRLIDMGNEVVGPGVTIDGLFVKDTFAADTNGTTGAWIRVGGLNDSGMVVVDGWRGAENNPLVQLNYASGLNGVSIKNISWNGSGPLFDFNGFTLTNLHVEDGVHVQGASGSMYANIPSSNQPNGVPAAITVGGSPYTYTNADNVKEAIYITGGTVSVIAKGGVTLAAASPLVVLLNPEEAVTVTYAVAPTMNKDLNRY